MSQPKYIEKFMKIVNVQGEVNRIFPKTKDDVVIPTLMKLIHFNMDVIKNEFVESYLNKKMMPRIRTYWVTRFPDLPLSQLDEIVEYAKKEYLECIKRHRMYKIYTTEIYVKDKTHKLYDMSTLKATGEVMKDQTYFKDPPDYIKDFNRFSEIVVPLDFSTVYFYNQEENALLDATKKEVLIIKTTD